MGFPPYWEHLAENYLRRGSSAGVVSREDAGRIKLSKGVPENYCKAFGESWHIDRENMNAGVEDCGNMIPGTVQHGTASNESSEPKLNIDSGLEAKI